MRVTVLKEGGHIAEIFDKQTGVNPLWTPPWPSIEPSTFDAAKHPEYGAGAEAKLLAGIMGHNICLDIFGGPSPEEAAAGVTVHGESAIAPYKIEEAERGIVARAFQRCSPVGVERRLELHGSVLSIRETVNNEATFDLPIAWTQHVTLGSPFLEPGVTQFRASATRSRVYESRFGADDYLQPGADFDWPLAPRTGGGSEDLRTFNGSAHSSAFTTHLMDPKQEHAWFVAFSPSAKLAFGYVWRQADFPWMGIWEENRSRTNTPWNGVTIARGMEFGVSPMPETRREMVDRHRLFDVPTYRWIPARSRLAVEYQVVVRPAQSIPDSLEPFQYTTGSGLDNRLG